MARRGTMAVWQIRTGYRKGNAYLSWWPKAQPIKIFGSISDVLKNTDDLTKSARSRSQYDNYDQTFDLFDSMVKLDLRTKWCGSFRIIDG